jgi:mycothiol synthase
MPSVRGVTVQLSRFDSSARPALLTLIDDPSLAAELGWLRDQGEFGDLLQGDHPRAEVWLAYQEGRPIGLAAVRMRPDARGRWAMVRGGVVDGHRRRGVARLMLDEVRRTLAASAEPGLYELGFSAWVPNEAAQGFASAHGFAHARTFWLMERSLAPTADPQWPAGVSIRVFDGSPAMLRDWNEVSNVSFADAYHGSRSTEDDCREAAAHPDFDPSGLALAYRAGRCVGFSRNAIHAGRGEVDMLGVAPEERGRRLGRALLRWGIGWLIERGGRRITLIVDGVNDGALTLYRSEGFAPVATRMAWSRPWP